MTEEGKLSRAIDKARREQERTHDEAQPPLGHLSEAYDVDERTSGTGGEPRRVPAPAEDPEETVVMHHDKWGQAASQIRSVCQKILGKQDDERPQVITVTSGARKEGKTTIAFNLAVGLSEAQDGRVLVLDSDLRGPGVYRVANIESERGLPHILKNDLELDGNIYETKVPGVDMISSPNVTELNGQQGLVVKRCKQLLQKLRRHYAFIIVDTPPVISSTESRVFGQEGDGVLMVARMESTPRDVVRRSVEELKNSGAELLGCLLTDRKHHIPSFIYRLLGHSPAEYYYEDYEDKPE